MFRQSDVRQRLTVLGSQAGGNGVTRRRLCDTCAVRHGEHGQAVVFALCRLGGEGHCVGFLHICAVVDTAASDGRKGIARVHLGVVLDLHRDGFAGILSVINLGEGAARGEFQISRGQRFLADGEILGFVRKLIVAHCLNGHGTGVLTGILVFTIGDGIILTYYQRGLSDYHSYRGFDLPAGVGRVTAQRYRRLGGVTRDGELPPLRCQFGGGSIVRALDHGDLDGVGARIGGILHFPAVPTVFDRDIAHAGDTGVGHDGCSLCFTVIDQISRSGEAEVLRRGRSFFDAILHTGGLGIFTLAQRDAGGIIARVGGGGGQSFIALFVGDSGCGHTGNGACHRGGFSLFFMQHDYTPYVNVRCKTFLHFGEHFMKKGPRLIFRRSVSAGAGYYPPCYSLLRGA